MSQLRQQGVPSLNKVKKAYIEGDGRISVFAQEEKDNNEAEKAKEAIEN